MRKGEKVEYNPEIHCGAKKKNGEPCTNIKGFGTQTPQQGRCKYHGGNSKGATTPEGKQKRKEAPLEAINQPRVNGQRKLKQDLYGDRLTGAIKVAYDQVRQCNSYDLINQMAAMFNATILESFTSAMNGTRQPWFLNDRKILKAAEMLLEDGELDEEYVTKLRLKLMGYDEKGWGTLVNQAAALVDKAQSMGKLDQHLSMMKTCITQILSLQDERSTQIIVSTLRQLVVDSGFPVEECDRILADARANNAMKSVEVETVEDD